MLVPSQVINTTVRLAQSLPDLARKLQEIDPALAKQITGRALSSTASAPVVAATAVLTYLSGRLGFGWSPDFTAALAGVDVLVVGYIARYLTKHPISGVFK